MQLPPRTQAALERHLPRDLAALAHSYLLPPDPRRWNKHDVGIVGHGELCEGIPDSYAKLLGICAGGHVELFKKLHPNRDELNSGLGEACSHGQMELIRHILGRKPSMVRWGLECACRHGLYEVAALVAASVPLGDDEAWRNGLVVACRYKHPALVRLMLSKGATRCYHCDKVDDGSPNWHD